MIKKYFAPNKDVELFLSLGFKEIALFLFFLWLYISSVQFLGIAIDTLFSIAIFTFFVTLWISYRSTKLELGEREFLLKYLNYFFEFQYPREKIRIYKFSSLINYSAASAQEISLVNSYYQSLLDNLLQYRKMKTEISFIVNSVNEKLGNWTLLESEHTSVPAFHPLRSLSIVVKSKSEKVFTEIEYHLSLFAEANKLSFQVIYDDERKALKSRQRFDYVRSGRQYVKSLILRDIELSCANYESINSFLKHLSCCSELQIILGELNLSSVKLRIKQKINYIESFPKQSLTAIAHLKSLKDLYTEIYNDKCATEAQVVLKLYSDSKEDLEKNILRVANANTFLSFREAKCLQGKLFHDLYKSKPFFLTRADLSCLNPFIEDRVSMSKGILIGYKLDDKSLVHYTPEDINFCNNKSINFIGDSGSGKSLAVKLLIKRKINPQAKFIILDSTLLGWEFFTEYMGGKIYNFEDLDTQLNLDINTSLNAYKSKFQLLDSSITLVNFHKIEKKQNLVNCFLELVFEQIEKAVKNLDAVIYLVIDEAWKLIYEEENPYSKKLISKLARTGRAMNLGLWTISQKPSDLTRDIHSSAASSFIFQCKENKDKEELASHLNLNEREIKIIESQEIKDRGVALLKTSKFSGLIRFEASPEELILSSSSAELVRERNRIFLDLSREKSLTELNSAQKTIQVIKEKSLCF